VWKARATCSANCVRVAPEWSSFNWNDSTKRNAEIQCVAVVCDHVRQEDLRVESENWADGRVVTEQSIGVGEAMNETLVRVVVSLDNGLDLGEELGEFGLHDGADEGVASGEVFVQGGPPDASAAGHLVHGCLPTGRVVDVSASLLVRSASMRTGGCWSDLRRQRGCHQCGRPQRQVRHQGRRPTKALI
jgi:hypothetical protein